MFEVISRIPGDGAPHKAGAAVSSASAALYDQILRSVLLALEAPAATSAAPPPAAADAAPWQENRTLEDILLQRQFNCSLNDLDVAAPADALALQLQQPTSPAAETAQPASREPLDAALDPWELLLGRLTLQQRLAG
ncbi:hypothetical protein [Phytopseudomonas dryadis]|uniref:Uncharacterized protein n=1 Tax=Phytopseudomonas dryadis TaxID=2487520 RepID=A0A4Q9QW63_9GAMM|nr:MULTISPECIES: hypothetical protein [Pseudomonas]TBU86551.1 hypothetical protein DNK44_22630 [Pseudomonas dryadis]TBV07251.1 hypothetical protein DNK34_08435 [Pseudomonas dryadis]TBV17884.1 hypothetical protein DNK41_12095 [Pseudomonas sp. FRB 230]